MDNMTPFVYLKHCDKVANVKNLTEQLRKPIFCDVDKWSLGFKIGLEFRSLRTLKTSWLNEKLGKKKLENSSIAVLLNISIESLSIFWLTCAPNKEGNGQAGVKL